MNRITYHYAVDTPNVPVPIFPLTHQQFTTQPVNITTCFPIQLLQSYVKYVYVEFLCNVEFFLHKIMYKTADFSSVYFAHNFAYSEMTTKQKQSLFNSFGLNDDLQRIYYSRT